MNTLKALLILLLVQAVPAQEPAAASVRGVVINRETGRPVADAAVELHSVRPASPARVTTSDAEGRFVISRLAAGSYRLNARRSGYVGAEYGQNGIHGPGVEFPLAAGQSLTVRIAMTPTGSIGGRITDRNGQPVGNARVQAFRAAYPDGQRVLTGVKEILSNDLGEYRLFWLSPGSYFVGVRVPDGPMGVTVLMNPAGTDSRGLYEARAQIGPVATTPVGSGSAEGEAHVPVFFPGSANVLLAKPLDVRPGDDIRGIDITAVPVRTQRVRGVLSNGSSGQPPGANAQVRLLPVTAGAGPEYQVQADPGTGIFEAPRVVPGSYIVMATIGGPNGVRARGDLEVRDRAVENLSLVAAASPSVPVRVTFEGQGPVAGLRVTLRADPFVAGVPSPATAVSAEGQGTLAGVLPGSYRLYVPPLLNPRSAAVPTIPEALRNLYVKSARLGGVDVLNDGLRLGGPVDGALEIIVGSTPGRVSGRVTPAAAGVAVVVVPDENRAFRTDRYGFAVTDAGGQFQLPAIPPGRYRLFAWADVAADAWTDPDFIRTYETQGKPLTIAEGDAHTIELTVIP
jgi:protocatechuate 3,4-dioxygenase beta subunit